MLSTDRYAVLLDGEFVRMALQRKLKHFPTVAELSNVWTEIGNHADLFPREVYRVYYYTADPLAAVASNPISGDTTDFGKTPFAKDCQRLHSQLELLPNVSVRRGDLALHGWKLGKAAQKNFKKHPGAPLTAKDLQPNIEQKGVDMRIGLDVAALALKRIVSTIVLVTGDSDMVPAMKFARREGLRVYLSTLDHIQIRQDLRIHADVVL